MNKNLMIGLSAAAVAVCCVCALMALTIGGGAYVYSTLRETSVMPTLDVQLGTPPATTEPLQVLTPYPTAQPIDDATAELLERTDIPVNDLRELAMRLKGIPDIPAIVSEQSADHPAGAELDFFASNTDTNEHFTVTARLVYKTENVYFFAEKGLQVNEDQVRALVDNFQNNIYPTTREFFGSEPNPGIDGDPHLYILYARGLGFSVAGYQSSADGYSRLAHEYSNEKEIFYINADTTGPNDPSLPGTLAHEFQHMIQGNHDGNEDTWMNEGSSVLAEFLNGYSADGFDYSFLVNPDLQLNAWSEGGPGADSIPHYGAGFLYMNYFLNRFGSEATKALVAAPANGLSAVDEVLAQLGMVDPLGNPITADDLFADWVIANYLGDTSLADGRYGYPNYPDAPRVSFPTDNVSNCPLSEQPASVYQYAADYIEITCRGNITISFNGSQQVNIVPTDPHSGNYAVWGNRSDKSDTTLTREFDFSGLSTVTFSYWAWWAIEEDYDYAYLVVSDNGGQTWQIIETPSCTSANPSGNNFGCGYHANSGGGGTSKWIKETVDLTAYAGKKVLVRFEHITDDAVNRPGLLIDDISIAELNYTEDFENGDGGWQGAGFVRMNNILRQKFLVQIIRQGDTTTIERLPLDANNTGSISLTVNSGEKIVLVISGITRFTTEIATYQFAVR